MRPDKYRPFKLYLCGKHSIVHEPNYHPCANFRLLAKESSVFFVVADGQEHITAKREIEMLHKTLNCVAVRSAQPHSVIRAKMLRVWQNNRNRTGADSLMVNLVQGLQTCNFVLCCAFPQRQHSFFGHLF